MNGGRVAHEADDLDLVHESVIVRDLDGAIVGWNLAAAELYGVPREDALGRPLNELLRTAHDKGLPALRAELLARGAWDGELTRRTASGESLLIEARWRLRPASGDRPAAVVETGRDVTRQKLAQDALARADHRYRNLFQAMAASFWELDFKAVGGMVYKLRKSGVTDLAAYFAENPAFVREMMRVSRVIDVNEETVKLFGMDRGSLPESVEPFWPPSENGVYAASVVAAVGGAPNFASDTRFQRADGSEFDALFTACFPQESVAQGALLIGVIDTSARTQAENALRKVQADFAHAARVSMLGELTASIAHEVNQPLAAIATNGAAGLRWLSRPEPDLDEIRELTDAVVSDARRAADIIARVRSMAAKRAPRPEALSVNAVVEEAMLFLRHELQAQGVTLALDLAPDLPEVLADRTQLQQVLVNLVVNAAQSMAQAECPRRDVLVATRLAGPGLLEASVRDSGPGIEGDNLDRLFQSFFTTKENGMGMGLPICRSIIEAHGGQMGAANVADPPGARFAFTLPAA
jgi:PAS domain S-box-containing protein